MHACRPSSSHLPLPCVHRKPPPPCLPAGRGAATTHLPASNCEGAGPTHPSFVWRRASSERQSLPAHHQQAPTVYPILPPDTLQAFFLHRLGKAPPPAPPSPVPKATPAGPSALLGHQQQQQPLALEAAPSSDKFDGSRTGEQQLQGQQEGSRSPSNFSDSDYSNEAGGCAGPAAAPAGDAGEAVGGEGGTGGVAGGGEGEREGEGGGADGWEGAQSSEEGEGGEQVAGSQPLGEGGAGGGAGAAELSGKGEDASKVGSSEVWQSGVSSGYCGEGCAREGGSREGGS